MLSVKRWAPLAPLAALFIALLNAPSPLWEVTPGPVRDVGPLIEVEGHPTYASQGNFVLAAVLVGSRPLTPLEALRAWGEPGVRLVPERRVRAPGASEELEESRATSQMDRSQIDAAAVVLRRLTGYPRDRGSGALVESVAAGCPADGRLFAGDRILTIDGERVDGRREASRLIRGTEPGTRLTFRVRAGGETTEVRLAREPCPGSEEDPVVGVVLIDSFPIDVRMRSGGIGGPSAGLAWALALWDRLTPGDLTGGATIAATGELPLGGRVLGVGSIEQKVVAVERAGATVFLVPEANLEEARAAATEVEVVGVATLADALEYLRANGGRDGDPLPGPTS